MNIEDLVDFTEFEGGASLALCPEASSIFDLSVETKNTDTASPQEIQTQDLCTPTPNSPESTAKCHKSAGSSGSGQNASALGVGVHRRNKPLSPIDLKASQDTITRRRARNTMAARKSRERKVQRLHELEERVKMLEADRDHWKSIALSRLSV